MSTFWRWGQPRPLQGPGMVRGPRRRRRRPTLLPLASWAKSATHEIVISTSSSSSLERSAKKRGGSFFSLLPDSPVSPDLTNRNGNPGKMRRHGKKEPWPSAAETSGGEQGGADRHHRLLGFQFSRTREAPRASLPFLSFRRGHDDGGDPVDPCR